MSTNNNTNTNNDIVSKFFKERGGAIGATGVTGTAAEIATLFGSSLFLYICYQNAVMPNIVEYSKNCICLSKKQY